MTSLTKNQTAALNYKNHISLTANAGSGKTFVLSRRYLEIALKENVSLKNIAAITFTDKAASELYKKIADQIDESLNLAKESDEVKKLENLRRQLVSANISTIHSFCINILREFPVEAKLDANFTPIDSLLSDELIELAVEEQIKKAFDDSAEEEKIKYLIRIFASKRFFARELISLIKNRKNVLLIAESIYKCSEEEIANNFHNLFLEYASILINQRKDEFLASFYTINHEVLASNPLNETALKVSLTLGKLNNAQTPDEFLTHLAQLISDACTSKGEISKKGYFSSQLRNGFEEEVVQVESIIKDLQKIELNENHELTEYELAKFGKNLLYFFHKTLESYNSVKKENGYLDFEDILLFTQTILNDAEVRNKLSDKFKYLMIDEYQDTNEIQYQIFLPILDHLKLGNLFVVGDEKQSIYMFRDADLEVFNRTKTEIEKSAGKEYLLSLPDSFRMAPELCLFTNTVFRNLFKNPIDIFNEVEHSDLVCAKWEENSGKIEILLSPDKKESEDDYEEAALLAKKIKKLIVEEKLDWKDIAVLCRKRKSFSKLEKIFVEQNIPFSILGGKGFYQRQTVYDVYNYFSFLLDKENDTALIGILRSPFFNISDSAIFEISLISGINFYSKLKDYAQENEKIKRIYNILTENLKLANSTNLAVLLRKIFSETEYLSVLASKSNSEQEHANIEKLINLTINFSAQGFNTLFDFVNFLNDSINESEDEAQAAVADESDAVKIMTIHQSKGLEFPAIFLFSCHEYSQNNSAKAKTIVIDKNFGILTKLPLNNNFFEEYAKAPVIGISDIITEKKNLAELKRLFYVGITRAKNYLFISARREEKYRRDSFMGMLLSGLDIDLNEKIYSNKKLLKCLIKHEENYSTDEKEIELNIPIVNEIEEVDIKNFLPEESIEGKKVIKIETISDEPSGEIISATKVAVFEQCPLKYQLTYEFGFSPLQNQYRKWFITSKKNSNQAAFEFNEKENLITAEALGEESEIKNHAEVKGRIIHKVLQDEITFEEAEKYVPKAIKDELGFLTYNSEFAASLEESMLSLLKIFFSSEEYKKLKSYKSYKNEFEVYLKEKDFYLYGIIDKLIRDDNKIIIADYKTDDIAEEDIPDRSQSYLIQLKFYAYIVSKLFKNIEEFEIRLIFIKHPEKVVKQNLIKKDFIPLQQKLDIMVNSVRKGNFNKNLNHCGKCLFAINFSKCIKS